MSRPIAKRRLGIIGGLGAIAGADLFFKLAQAAAANRASADDDIIFEQHPFDEGEIAGSDNASPNGRKLYIFDLLRQFEARGVDRVMVPCFISHTFLDELQPEVKVPIVDLMKALLTHVQQKYPGQASIGVLTSNYVRMKGLFERYFEPQRFKLVYPDAQTQEDCVMQAIYGPEGIKAGHLQGTAVDLLYDACVDLLKAGAQVIVPGATEIAIVANTLRGRGIPIIDANSAYVQYALSYDEARPNKPVKIGVVGGVGPAATVDFMNKIIRNTDASKDQDHVKLLVEHNPQIPDRTANLIGDGRDPTIAIYAACKKLEASDADLIAIPCNTAHAFVDRIQPYLSIPIVNMLSETADFIRERYGNSIGIGLLATSGTVTSRVYHAAFEAHGMELIIPDEFHQQKVMSAIYGPLGVKAGHADGMCKMELLQAVTHLADRGAQVIILGCTELPLVLSQAEAFAVAGATVAILDPTDILARKCASLAQTVAVA